MGGLGGLGFKSLLRVLCFFSVFLRGLGAFGVQGFGVPEPEGLEQDPGYRI